MTQAEQASLDALRSEVQAGFKEMRGLMETRRVEEVRVQAALTARIEKVDARVDEYDKAKTIAEAFFDFGKWFTGVLVVVLGLVFAYMSTNGHSL